MPNSVCFDPLDGEKKNTLTSNRDCRVPYSTIRKKFRLYDANEDDYKLCRKFDVKIRGRYYTYIGTVYQYVQYEDNNVRLHESLLVVHHLKSKYKYLYLHFTNEIAKGRGAERYICFRFNNVSSI